MSEPLSSLSIGFLFMFAQNASVGSREFTREEKAALLEYVTGSNNSDWTAWLHDTSMLVTGSVIACLLCFLAYSIYTRIRSQRRIRERMF